MNIHLDQWIPRSWRAGIRSPLIQRACRPESMTRQWPTRIESARGYRLVFPSPDGPVAITVLHGPNPPRVMARFIPPPVPAQAANFSISRSVRRDILRALGKHRPERGGLLGGDRKHGRITHFWHDQSPLLADPTTYEPNHQAINQVLRDWNARGVDLVGMVHSHPASFAQPSAADCEYARRILHHIPAMDQFFMPIVLTRCESGQARIYPYVVRRSSPHAYELCQLQTSKGQV